MRESRLAEAIVRHAKALYDRGLTHGSTGNISVRLTDGWRITPTGTSFAHLEPARLSRLGLNGELLSGDAQTKEAKLHRATCDVRRAARLGRRGAPAFHTLGGDVHASKMSTPKMCSRR